jgi:hypothetical protein
VLDLLMGRRVRLPLDMAAQASVLSHLFESMRDDVEAKSSMLEVLVVRALVQCLDVLPQPLNL